MKRERTKTERKLDENLAVEKILREPSRASAKYWFSRKPYAAFDLRKGDAGGQEHTNRI